MHHPWRWIGRHLPEWTVLFVPLPAGEWGTSDAATRTIEIDRTLLQVQRRCTLEHEVQHAVRGDVGPQSAWRERQVSEAAARQLVPLNELVEAAIWAVDITELADECWVDVDTMQCRLDTLTDEERAQVKQAIAIRDWHEEGMTR